MGQAAAKEVAHGPQYKTNVMFLCNHNSCRSQMADGWLRQLRGDAEDGVASAGIVGGTAVKPGAVEVMREAGVDEATIAAVNAHTKTKLIEVTNERTAKRLTRHRADFWGDDAAGGK